MGGDEFAAVLPADRDVSAEACAAGIVECLRRPLLIDGRLVQSGASIGIAYGNLNYDDGDDLPKRADLAMYEAKAAGSTTYRVFDDVMEERLSARVNIRAELARAMVENELSLNFQPIISARTGEMKSAEVLLRWRSPRLGNVSPAMLIPIAEESGLQGFHFAIPMTLADLVIHRADQAAALAAFQKVRDVPVPELSRLAS